MFNRLAVTAVLFSVFSLILLASGCTVHIPTIADNTLPSPRIYTQADMIARQVTVEPVSIAVSNIKVTKHVAKFTVKESIDPKQLKCLQENIYYESRDQSIIGQVLVGVVTLARTEKQRYPDTICGVVFQRKQFSWANHGRRHPNLKNSIERAAWEQAGFIARLMIGSGVDKYANDLTHYHTTSVKPKWSKSDKLIPVLTIGDHIFYQEQS